MSSESSESDHIIFPAEEIELKESPRKTDYSDSESNAEFSDSCKMFEKHSETDVDNDSENATTLLTIIDENHQEFDSEKASFRSLESKVLGSLTKVERSSPDSRPNVLPKEASSLAEASITKTSSLDNLKESSTRESRETSRLSRVSPLNTLERLIPRKFSSLNSLEEPSNRRFPSTNTTEPPLTRRIMSLDSIEGHLSRKFSPLIKLKGSSTREVSSTDSAEAPSTREVSSADTLETPSTVKVSSPDPLECPVIGRVPSSDPLEGPSTRTVWFPDSAKCSSTSICESHNSETVTDEPFNNYPPTESNGYFFRFFAWLSSFLRRYSRQIRHSRYYLLFHVALLSLPFSAGYMGSKYQKLCNGCPKLPFLVYLLGAIGMGIMIIRIAAILSERYFSPPLTGRELNHLMVALLVPFFLYLSIEMFTIFICEPVFMPPTHEEFCIRIFYDYACGVNVIVLLVIILLLLIYLPGINDPAEAE